MSTMPRYPILILNLIFNACLTRTRRFDIPPPTVGECEIRIKHNPQHAYRFQQHDFHLSYAPFLKALPAELQMTRAALEVNRYGN
jgi:hypothetical protein